MQFPLLLPWSQDDLPNRYYTHLNKKSFLSSILFTRNPDRKLGREKMLDTICHPLKVPETFCHSRWLISALTCREKGASFAKHEKTKMGHIFSFSVKRLTSRGLAFSAMDTCLGLASRAPIGLSQSVLRYRGTSWRGLSITGRKWPKLVASRPPRLEPN